MKMELGCDEEFDNQNLRGRHENRLRTWDIGYTAI